MAARNTRLEDVMLIDLLMPVMDGYALAAQIRKKSDAHLVALIAITASVDEISKQKALASGFNNFLVKPAVIKDAIEAVEEHLSHKQAVAFAIVPEMTITTGWF